MLSNSRVPKGANDSRIFRERVSGAKADRNELGKLVKSSMRQILGLAARADTTCVAVLFDQPTTQRPSISDGVWRSPVDCWGARA